jgi:hypothetical protein
MSHKRWPFCPFVDQAGLVERMGADLRRLRAGWDVMVYTEDDAHAAELLDRWLDATVNQLRRRRVRADDLQLIALEWQTRRVRFLGSAGADVIVVDS